MPIFSFDMPTGARVSVSPNDNIGHKEQGLDDEQQGSDGVTDPARILTWP